MRKVPQHDMTFLLGPLGGALAYQTNVSHLSIGIFRANLELISTYHLQHVTIPWELPRFAEINSRHRKASYLF